MDALHNFSCRTITRQFSASEVERVTGVTGVTQRDWRRRGFLSEISGGGRAQYSLDELIESMVLGILTRAGLSISQAAQLAGLAVLPIYANFARWPDVSVFSGDPLDESQMARVREGTVVGASDDDNWLYAVLDEGRQAMGRTSDLATLNGGLRGAACAIILDLNIVAHRIAEGSSLPLITYSIKAAD